MKSSGIKWFNSSGKKYLPRAKVISIVNDILMNEFNKSFKINVIITDDDTIKKLNKEFLNHDYATDVLSFMLEEEPLEGEIYISADTACEQSNEFGVSLSNELIRLAAHGALHLAGYEDATDIERKQMHDLENRYMEKLR
ncbi:MAG: rRNA maturation RNase YbeY [Candidatus Kapaibacterium sp.]